MVGGIGPLELIIVVLIGLTMLAVVAFVVSVVIRLLPPSSKSLVPCPDCGRRVSPLAIACPQCGRPLNPAS